MHQSNQIKHFRANKKLLLVIEIIILIRVHEWQKRIRIVQAPAKLNQTPRLQQLVYVLQIEVLPTEQSTTTTNTTTARALINKRLAFSRVAYVEIGLSELILVQQHHSGPLFAQVLEQRLQLDVDQFLIQFAIQIENKIVQVTVYQRVLLVQNRLDELDRRLEVFVLDLLDAQQKFTVQVLAEQDLQEDVECCLQIIVGDDDYVLLGVGCFVSALGNDHVTSGGV